MTPVIFFCASATQADALAVALGPDARSTGRSTMFKPDVLTDFRSGDFRVLCTTHRYATGWRAPHGTKVFFMDGFPADSATRIQAESRVSVLDH